MNYSVVILLITFVASSALAYVSRHSVPFFKRREFRLCAVAEVFSVSDFESQIKNAGSSLVVIDYSTTWCGPCKMVLPKFSDLSNRYGDVVFLKCIGDSSKDASELMKKEGVRSVPAFHFWKGGKRLDTINGARIEDVEAAILRNK